MTPDRWLLIKDLFAQALDVDGPTRTGWLDARCAGDDALRAEVDSLLAAHSAPATTLDTPAKDRAGLGQLNLVEVLKEQQALAALRRPVLPPRDDE